MLRYTMVVLAGILAFALVGGEAPAQGAAPGRTLVAAKTANVRAEPGTSAAVLGRIAAGATVKVTGQTTAGGATWYKVVLPTGKEGYVLGELLAEKGPTAAPRSVSRDPAVAKAQAALTTKDYAAAERLARPLAEAGNAEAQYLLGTLYVEGRGVAESAEQALAWWRKAAAQGNADAEAALGFMYAEGRGVPQNYDEAVKWWRQAAGRKNAAAQRNLGVMYAEGVGVPQNDKEALKWFTLAAEQGHVEAQTDLGFMYSEGRGTPRDFAKAAEWFRRAAEAGDPEAQYNLGVAYTAGSGVRRDFAQAADWFQRAAKQGHGDAPAHLGGFYARGLGVQKDLVAAHLWLTLAVARSDRPDVRKMAAERLASLEQEMSAEELEAARKTARELQQK